MARRKKTDNVSYDYRRQEGNGSVGLSKEALDALNNGTYGQTNTRKMQYRTSQEQTIPNKREIPELPNFDAEALRDAWESSLGRNKRQQNINNRNQQMVVTPEMEARNLRNRGYESSYNKVDLSNLDTIDKEMLDYQLEHRNDIERANRTRNTDLLGFLRPENQNPATNETRQMFLDKYGASYDDVLNAYQQVKDAEDKQWREDHPWLASIGDLPSAFERGIENAAGWAAHMAFPHSDLDLWLNNENNKKKTIEVEKQRDYSRNSDKIGDTEKKWLEGAYQTGDLISSSLAGGLIGGGVGVVNPETGFALAVEPAKIVGQAARAIPGYGLGAESKYQELIKQGVDEEKARQLANISGLMTGAQAGFMPIGSTKEGISTGAKILYDTLKQGGIAIGRQAADEMAENLVLENESTLNKTKQAYMEQGQSESEATKNAWLDLLGRLGMAGGEGALWGGVTSAIGNLALPKVKSNLNASDDLNSVWATQPALEDKGVPMLTGSVESPNAVSGSTYNSVPALVDNIYPIQMPGTNGVIPLTGTQGVISNLPDLSGTTAPTVKTMNESVGWTNPRLVKKLEGTELANAKAQIKANNDNVTALTNKIDILKNDKANYYRGNLKKAVQQEIKGIEKEIAGLQKANKDLDLQTKGGMKPVLDMLSAEQKNLIYDTSGKYDSVFSKINFAAKFAGDTPEAKALAKEAQNAIRAYVKSGKYADIKKAGDALTELDIMAKTVNTPYVSKKGNEWTYDKVFGDDPAYFTNLRPVADIYNAEVRAARAAKANQPQTAGESAPVETTPKGIQVYRGYNRSNNPLETNLAKQRSIYDVLGKEDPNKVDMLPLEYYTDSIEDATNYANQDKVLYDLMQQKGVDYETMTGRKPEFNGHVESKTINPQKVLDLSELGELTSVDNIYNYLAKVTGKTPSEIDDILRLGAIEYDQVGNRVDIPAYSVLRNFDNKEGAVGSRFVDFLRDNGYDAVKYKESGANHYALLNNKAETKAPVNEVPTVSPTPAEPNFSLVGDSYVPQEVPNVQPTPPTNNVPPTQEEVPNLGGEEKTSKYYKSTMRNTETNQGMSDEEYAQRYDEALYKYMSRSEKMSVDMANDFIKKAGGDQQAIDKLLSGEFDGEERFNSVHFDAAHILADKLEKQALELEANGQDASELWRLSNKLHRKARENDTLGAQILQANKKWKKSTPQGAVDDLIMNVNRGLDKHKTPGYTRNVNKLADKVEDAIETAGDTAEQIEAVRKVFADDRKTNRYDTTKVEEKLVNFIKESKTNKRSVSDLIEEAGKIVKKNMDVSTLTAREERAIVNLLNEASEYEVGSRPYNELVTRAMMIYDDTLPSSLGARFKSLLYDNMLSSMKTMLTRNLGGNLGANAIENIATPIQVAADWLVGKKTGNRTRTLSFNALKEGVTGFGKGWKNWGLDIKQGINTPRSGQESLEDVLQNVHKTFKGDSDVDTLRWLDKAGSVYDRIVRKGMEGGDRPIYEAKYAATKAELQDVVDKFGEEGLRKGLPTEKDYDTDDLIEFIAINEALEAVLQNDSKMKQGAQYLKKLLKLSSEDALGFDIVSMPIAPFVEVPANMASRFFQYTPVGVVGNLGRAIYEKRHYGGINQRRFTGELGRNVLGGLLTAGAVGLAAKGLISDPYSKDEDEKKLQQNNGYQEYALQKPDESTQIDISDIPVLGGMLRYGKTLYDAYKEGAGEDNDMGAGLDSALGALPQALGATTVDTLYQGLNKLTGADNRFSSGSSMVANALNALTTSAGSMAIPALIRQTAQYTDDYKRDLGDYGTREYNKNLVKNGLPSVRQNELNPKIDTAGNPVPELGGETGVNRFMSAYVYPWKISHPTKNMSEVQKYANELKEATGGKVNPQMQVINKDDITDIKGYDKDGYKHEDLRKFQEQYYKSNTELGDTLIQNSWFTSLPAEKQGEYLDALWKANKNVQKEKFVRDGKTSMQIDNAGDELYTAKGNLEDILKSDDNTHSGVLEYFKDYADIDNLNAKYGSKITYDTYKKWQTEDDKKALGGAEAYCKAQPKAHEADMTVENYLKTEKNYQGGVQGKMDDKQTALDYGFVDKDGKANLDNLQIAKNLSNGVPEVMQAYADYKKQGFTKANSKVTYLSGDDRFTDEQKGMILAGSTDGSKIDNLAKGAKELYNIGNSDNKNDGYEGVYYYYLLKNLADVDGSGTVTKKERQSFFENDSRELDDLWAFNQDMYYYLMDNLK